MQIVFLLEQVVNGLVLGGYYLLLALGLSLIFSVGGVVNLAHGAFYALGAYLSLEVGRRLGFGAAIIISPLLVGLLGIAFERLLLRRFYTADPILSLLVTFSLALVAEPYLLVEGIAQRQDGVISVRAARAQGLPALGHHVPSHDFG
jgi:branched-chain amino acid transport system permease protein